MLKFNVDRNELLVPTTVIILETFIRMTLMITDGHRNPFCFRPRTEAMLFFRRCFFFINKDEYVRKQLLLFLSHICFNTFFIFVQVYFLRSFSMNIVHYISRMVRCIITDENRIEPFTFDKDRAIFDSDLVRALSSLYTQPLLQWVMTDIFRWVVRLHESRSHIMKAMIFC